MSRHADFLEKRMRERVRETAAHLRELADEVERLADRPAHTIPGSVAHTLAWGFVNAQPGETARMLGDLHEAMEAERSADVHE